MYLKSTRIYFPYQICRSGYLEVAGEVIRGFSTEVPADAEVIDYGDHLLIPGLSISISTAGAPAASTTINPSIQYRK